MPVAFSPPDSDQTEGSILREFVDANIAREQRERELDSPRSELLSQASHQHNSSPTTERHRVSRPRRSKRHGSDREAAYADASPNELLKLLVDQKYQSRKLRRTLYEQMAIEAQRAAEVERVNSDVADRFKILNESRLEAQRDALKASQELTLYQAQLRNAQDEITRAQEALRVVQAQRDEAELSAARARDKARQLQQERIVAAAREEGRQFGFQNGFKRAHQEYNYLTEQNPRRISKPGKKRTEQLQQAYRPVEDTAYRAKQQNGNTGPAATHENGDQLSPIASPTRLPLRSLAAEAYSPEVIRVNHQPLAFQAPDSHTSAQPPQLQPPPALRPSYEPSHEPAPLVQPNPANPRYSPSIPPIEHYAVSVPPASEIERQLGRHEFREAPPRPQAAAVQQPIHSTPANSRYSPSIPPFDVYAVSIPPASEIEQRFGRNEEIGQNEILTKSSHPWVTANEHLQMSDRDDQSIMRQHFEEIFPPSAELQRDMSQQPTSSNSKPKERWYQTLRRKTFGRKRKQEAPNYFMPETPVDRQQSGQSWFMPRPPVHVRDFAVPMPTSAESGSVSTRVSQLDIVGKPQGSASGRSVTSGGAGRGFKQNLHAISEDPMSRGNTPVRNDPGHRQSKSVDVLDARGSSYSDPKALDEWRKSTASNPNSKATSIAWSRRPPPNIRRPSKLTVPQPLARTAESQGSSRARTLSDNTGTSSQPRLRQRPSNRSSLRVVNVDEEPEVSPGIGITVQPPSRSPTDAALTPSSSYQGSGYLSPHHAHNSLPTQPVNSVPSFSSMGHAPSDPSTAQETNQNRSRPLSSHGYAPSVRSVRSTSQNHGDSWPNSPHASVRNQPLPSFANGWPPRSSPSRTSQPLAPDDPGPSRPQSRAGAATPYMPSADVRMTPGSVRTQPLPPANDHNHGLSHVASNTSLRSAGSYARYNPSTYLDPAFIAVDSNVSDRPRSVSSPAPRTWTHSKAASTASSLSYVTGT